MPVETRAYTPQFQQSRIHDIDGSPTQMSQPYLCWGHPMNPSTRGRALRCVTLHELSAASLSQQNAFIDIDTHWLPLFNDTIDR